ncbi:sigma 54-interacting transcriptional regulator [Clostridiaceae bacterium 35-E11]
MDVRLTVSIDLYKAVLEKVSEGIFMYQDSGKILWCNNTAAQFLGKTKKDLLGVNIQNFLPLAKNSKKILTTFKMEIEGKPLKFLEVKEETLKEGIYKIKIAYLKDITIVQQTEEHFYSNKSRKMNYDQNYYKPKYRLEDIVGENDQLCDIKVLAQRAAVTSSPILIYGETGTGKELFAQGIHNRSSRANKKFIAINCAAIPEHLLESIFFGTVKGAYTGAVDRIGLLEIASEGTLFLDEMNSMPMFLQSKLLRVFQEGSLRKVGGNYDIPVNPRIISAMNISPLKAMENHLLRRDLFYRLGVVCIEIPALRDRKDDISILADYFVKKLCRKFNRKYKKISQEVLEFFNGYDWPGNIRQLEYVLQGMLILMKEDEPEILLEHLPEYLRITQVRNPVVKDPKIKIVSLQDEIDKIEKNKIIAALEEASGNISKAARKLKISRQNLYYRMKKFQINISTSKFPNKEMLGK